MISLWSLSQFPQQPDQPCSAAHPPHQIAWTRATGFPSPKDVGFLLHGPAPPTGQRWRRQDGLWGCLQGKTQPTYPASIFLPCHCLYRLGFTVVFQEKNHRNIACSLDTAHVPCPMVIRNLCMGWSVHQREDPRGISMVLVTCWSG